MGTKYHLRESQLCCASGNGSYHYLESTLCQTSLRGMICIIISYHNWPQELGLIRYSVPFYDIFMGHPTTYPTTNGSEMNLFSSHSMALGELGSWGKIFCIQSWNSSFYESRTSSSGALMMMLMIKCLFNLNALLSRIVARLLLL